MSSLMLSVFVLQVVAAGFCAPMVSASPIEQTSAMEHCLSPNMELADVTLIGQTMDKSMATHACAHCDLPEVSIVLDKHTFAVADLSVDIFVIALVPTASEVEVVSFVDAPPGLLTLKNSLSTYNLNLRVRV